MENQGQRHALWRPKKDNFDRIKSGRWSQSVFVPKFLRKEEEKEEKEKNTEKQ